MPNTDDSGSIPEPEPPTKKELIKAYIQYSEESRYRDGLMHNSYYFILIAVVIFAGHLISLDISGPLLESSRFGFAVFSGGIVSIGIGVVMRTYNRKKINAEDQRQVLENILDDWFTETGLHHKYGSEDYETREEDNPFAIQSTVIGRTKGPTESFFIKILPIKWVATIGMVIGVAAILAGICIMA